MEIAALASMGIGTYSLAGGPLRWLAAIGVPLAAAAIWGIFNVPGDRSRSGKAPVPVAGRTRLAIEVAYFAGAVAVLRPEYPTASAVLAVITLIHYALSVDRLRWLMSQSGSIDERVP